MGEDGIEDSFHAGSIGEDAHGPGSSSEFPEPAFNEVSCPDFFPYRRVLDCEEGQEFFFRLFEGSQSFWIENGPFVSEVFQGRLGFLEPFGMADGSEIFLDVILVHFSDVVQDVPGFVSPTPLSGNTRIDEG